MRNVSLFLRRPLGVRRRRLYNPIDGLRRPPPLPTFAPFPDRPPASPAASAAAAADAPARHAPPQRRHRPRLRPRGQRRPPRSRVDARRVPDVGRRRRPDWLAARAEEGFGAYLIFGVIDRAKKDAARLGRARPGQRRLPPAPRGERSRSSRWPASPTSASASTPATATAAR